MGSEAGSIDVGPASEDPPAVRRSSQPATTFGSQRYYELEAEREAIRNATGEEKKRLIEEAEARAKVTRKRGESLPTATYWLRSPRVTKTEQKKSAEEGKKKEVKEAGVEKAEAKEVEEKTVRKKGTSLPVPTTTSVSRILRQAKAEQKKAAEEEKKKEAEQVKMKEAEAKGKPRRKKGTSLPSVPFERRLTRAAQKAAEEEKKKAEREAKAEGELEENAVKEAQAQGELVKEKDVSVPNIASQPVSATAKETDPTERRPNRATKIYTKKPGFVLKMEAERLKAAAEKEREELTETKKTGDEKKEVEETQRSEESEREMSPMAKEMHNNNIIEDMFVKPTSPTKDEPSTRDKTPTPPPPLLQKAVPRFGSWMPSYKRVPNPMFHGPVTEEQMKNIVRKWYCCCEGKGDRSVIAILGIDANGPCYQIHKDYKCDYETTGKHTCGQDFPGLIWCNCTLIIKPRVACVAREDVLAENAKPFLPDPMDKLPAEVEDFLQRHTYAPIARVPLPSYLRTSRGGVRIPRLTSPPRPTRAKARPCVRIGPAPSPTSDPPIPGPIASSPVPPVSPTQSSCAHSRRHTPSHRPPSSQRIEPPGQGLRQ